MPNSVPVAQPDYRSASFLLRHIRHTLSFYDDKAVDPAGGFFQCFLDNGDIFDRDTRTLVGSCRFVFNYARAYLQFGEARYLEWTKHGMRYLRQVHRNPATGGYAWKIVAGRVADDTNHCYGLAFVLLASAWAMRAGMQEAKVWLEETFELMEKRFWLEEFGVYANEADGAWKLSSYRGQNDNMHACEALLAAFEATGERHYLERAALLATQFTNGGLPQAALPDGQIWEHYRSDWHPDLEYNKRDASNHIRPWGIQTGHQTEWAKLLLILDRHAPAEWHTQRAQALFDISIEYGWDAKYGGLFYGYDLSGSVCFDQKYFWVQAENLAAAALLADRTGKEKYWQWYKRIWEYCWQHFVDHQYGAWYRILSVDNQRLSDRKSCNNKTDYHTMGACYEVLNVLGKR